MLSLVGIVRFPLLFFSLSFRVGLAYARLRWLVPCGILREVVAGVRSGSGRILSGSGFKGGFIGHRRVPFECQINGRCWSGGTGARLPFRWPGKETGKILLFTIPPS